jgi:hypothetical protein
MRRLGGFLAALAVVMGTAGACSDGGDEAASGRASTTTTTEAPVAIAFTTASFDIQAAAEPIPGGVEGARVGIETTLNRWLEEGVLRSLRSGQPVGDIGSVFTAVARDRIATTADRAAFVYEGLPPASGVRAGVATLAMTALADTDGNIPMVTVHVDLTLGGMAEGTPLGIEHTGDLVMLPDGDAWRIDGYDIRATRATAGGTTTTTAAR